MINEVEARRAHLKVGSRITLYAYSMKQALAAGNGGFGRPSRPQGPQFEVQVVGIVREPSDIAVVPVNQDVAYEGSATIYVTPAFAQRFAVALGVPFAQLPGNEIVRVRFRHGVSDVPAFTFGGDGDRRGRRADSCELSISGRARRRTNAVSASRWWPC